MLRELICIVALVLGTYGGGISADPSGSSYGSGDWADFLDRVAPVVCQEAYAWDCGEALAIVWCESRGQADAISPDGSNLGWFQINAIHLTYLGLSAEQLLEPHTNTAVAYGLWESRGWQPWACSPY